MAALSLPGQTQSEASECPVEHDPPRNDYQGLEIHGTGSHDLVDADGVEKADLLNHDDLAIL